MSAKPPFGSVEPSLSRIGRRLSSDAPSASSSRRKWRTPYGWYSVISAGPLPANRSPISSSSASCSRGARLTSRYASAFDQTTPVATRRRATRPSTRRPRPISDAHPTTAAKMTTGDAIANAFASIQGEPSTANARTRSGRSRRRARSPRRAARPPPRARARRLRWQRDEHVGRHRVLGCSAKVSRRPDAGELERAQRREEIPELVRVPQATRARLRRGRIGRPRVTERRAREPRPRTAAACGCPRAERGRSRRDECRQEPRGGTDAQDSDERGAGDPQREDGEPTAVRREEGTGEDGDERHERRGGKLLHARPRARSRRAAPPARRGRRRWRAGGATRSRAPLAGRARERAAPRGRRGTAGRARQDPGP